MYGNKQLKSKASNVQPPATAISNINDADASTVFKLTTAASSASSQTSSTESSISLVSSIDEDIESYKEMISEYISQLGVNRETEAQIYAEELKKIEKLFDKDQTILTASLTKAEEFISRETVIDTPEKYNSLVKTINDLEQLIQSEPLITEEQKFIVNDYLSVLKKLILIHTRRFATNPDTNNFVESTIKALQTASVVKSHLIKVAIWVKDQGTNLVNNMGENYDSLAQKVIGDLFTQDKTADSLSEISNESISNIATRLRTSSNNNPNINDAIQTYLTSEPNNENLNFLTVIFNRYLHSIQQSDKDKVESKLDFLGIIIKQGEIMKSRVREIPVEVLSSQDIEHIDDNVAQAIRYIHSTIDRIPEQDNTTSFNESHPVIERKYSNDSVISDLGLGESASQDGTTKRPPKRTRKGEGGKRKKNTQTHSPR